MVLAISHGPAHQLQTTLDLASKQLIGFFLGFCGVSLGFYGFFWVFRFFLLEKNTNHPLRAYLILIKKEKHQSVQNQAASSQKVIAQIVMPGVLLADTGNAWYDDRAKVGV